MGKTTLLAFGLVVIALIQINAAPSPVAPHVDPATGPGKCVGSPTKALSTHDIAEYRDAAKNLKNWIETTGTGLMPHGNGEQCLPALGKGQRYVEGYVPFRNALEDNRGKGAVVPVVVPIKGKGKGKGTGKGTGKGK